jgi:hypothetical protein
MKLKAILLSAAIVLAVFASNAQKRSSGSSRVTSPRMAKTASSTLRDPGASKREKSLAGSTLSQSRGKKN